MSIELVSLARITLALLFVVGVLAIGSNHGAR